MSYKLDPIVERIQSPIILRFLSTAPDQHFSNGKQLANFCFSCKYLIDSISTLGNAILITLLEHQETFPTDWTNEETISFF